MVTAARPKPFSSIKKIFMFEILSSTNWNISGNKFNPNYFEDISKYIDKKKILKIYKSEMPKGNHTRSLKNIVRLSEIRGCQVGIKMLKRFIYLGRLIEL